MNIDPMKMTLLFSERHRRELAGYAFKQNHATNPSYLQLLIWIPA
jgi:hypothetical protein